VRVFKKGKTYVVTAESKLQNYDYMNDSNNIKQRKFVKIEGAWYPMRGINAKAIFAEYFGDTNVTYALDDQVRVHSRKFSTLGVWMTGKYKGETEENQHRVYVKEQGRIVLIPKDEPDRIQKVKFTNAALV